jgi:hypothetical protein
MTFLAVKAYRESKHTPHLKGRNHLKNTGMDRK